MVRFRPLARYIGLYLKGVDYVETRLAIESPSPREVNRVISLFLTELSLFKNLSFCPLSR